jgi:hypothetical protein
VITSSSRYLENVTALLLSDGDDDGLVVGIGLVAVGLLLSDGDGDGLAVAIGLIVGLPVSLYRELV